MYVNYRFTYILFFFLGWFSMFVLWLLFTCITYERKHSRFYIVDRQRYLLEMSSRHVSIIRFIVAVMGTDRQVQKTLGCCHTMYIGHNISIPHSPTS